MTSSLPSSHRRINSEGSEIEETFWDSKDLPKTSGEGMLPGVRKISPATFSRASQCLLRGLRAARGVAGLPPSPYTEAMMEDGESFEEALLEKDNRPVWLRALGQALQLPFPEDLRIANCKQIRLKEKESAEEFTSRTTTALREVSRTAGEPMILTQTTLAKVEEGTLLHGRPDLLIWTGQEWVIADIKCSEEGKRTHGIQIAAYARMLEAMLNSIDPGSPVHPSGVIIHCAPGYRYTNESNRADKETAIAHTQATAFPISSLEESLQELIDFLRPLGEEQEEIALGKAVFTSACNECEFRLTCYPRFLSQQHISLLPLLKAELEAILDCGISSIEELLKIMRAGKESESTHPQYQTLLELKENSPLQLGFLRQKAESILGRGLYSAWRAHPTVTTHPLFFVSTGDSSLFAPTPDADSNATCLVVYSEGERRRAWGELFQIKRAWNLTVFVLSKELQQTLHGPIPSLTLRPLAEFLRWVEEGKPLADFTSKYPSGTDIESFAEHSLEATNAQDRLEQLKIVWHFLQSAAIPFQIDHRG